MATMRFSRMVSPSSLLIEKPDGEQIVRGPRSTDAIGALLQRVYAVRRAMPDMIARLVPRIDRADEERPLSDRR